jgi:hypothetical protein
MTIRQEIKEILDTVCDDIEETDDHSTDLEKHMYEIISIFTKLINSKIDLINENYIVPKSVIEIELLQELKKELKK